ncbi:MAG: rRNA maturation RNase YbeY [Ginsengibacter sp.]
MNKISFKNHGVVSGWKKDKKFVDLAKKIFLIEGYEFRSLTFILTSDEELLKLNKEFLGHDTFTDILTFSLNAKFSGIISEIFISVERVRENADIFKQSFDIELRRVMIHGILHLCGYQDISKKSKKNMSAREDFYLDLYQASL